MASSSNLAMRQDSMVPETRKFVEGYGFLSFDRNLSNTYWKQLKDTDANTGLHALKISKKVLYRAAKVAGKFIGNKVAEKIVKPKSAFNENLWDIEERIIPSENGEKMLNESRQVL